MLLGHSWNQLIGVRVAPGKATRSPELAAVSSLTMTPRFGQLEQGLEESMAGSDPINVTQPVMPIAEKPENNAEPGDDS
jgi:hypothetical protein